MQWTRTTLFSVEIPMPIFCKQQYGGAVNMVSMCSKKHTRALKRGGGGGRQRQKGVGARELLAARSKWTGKVGVNSARERGAKKRKEKKNIFNQKSTQNRGDNRSQNTY
jgi:hypothetical protein